MDFSYNEEELLKETNSWLNTSIDGVEDLFHVKWTEETYRQFQQDIETRFVDYLEWERRTLLRSRIHDIVVEFYERLGFDIYSRLAQVNELVDNIMLAKIGKAL